MDASVGENKGTSSGLRGMMKGVKSTSGEGGKDRG